MREFGAWCLVGMALFLVLGVMGGCFMTCGTVPALEIVP